MSDISPTSSASAFSIAAGGMASASARLDAAATAVATDSSDSGVEQAAVAISESKVAFAASAKVADVANQLQGLLVDLLA